MDGIFPSSSVFFFFSLFFFALSRGIAHLICPPQMRSQWMMWMTQPRRRASTGSSRSPPSGSFCPDCILMTSTFPRACFDLVSWGRSWKKNSILLLRTELVLVLLSHDRLHICASLVLWPCKQIRRGCHSQVQPLPQQVVRLYQPFSLSSLKAESGFVSYRVNISVLNKSLSFLSFWVFFYFTTHSGIQETLPRLTAMIRGIGDPLVAAYTRAYLCRVRCADFSSFIQSFLTVAL